MPLQESSRIHPERIIILSGKRKSGKDYVADYLLERFGRENCAIVRLSGPLKERYALEHNLDYERLLESTNYKEIYRKQMIIWGEDIRKKDPGYFCKHAILQSQAASKNIWIVSDARRQTDLDFFLTNYPDVTCTVRISASDSVRKERGWKYEEGVDNCESECGLDSYQNWSVKILNNDQNQMENDIQELLGWINVKYPYSVLT